MGNLWEISRTCWEHMEDMWKTYGHLLENGGKSIERDSDLGHHLVWEDISMENVGKMEDLWEIDGKSMGNLWNMLGKMALQPSPPA